MRRTGLPPLSGCVVAGKGMTDAMLHELIAVVGLVNETNRLANGYRIPVDERFLPGTAQSSP